MKVKEMLKKYRTRLVAESIVKALLIAASVGFVANLVAAALSFFFAPSTYWIGFVVWAGITVLGTPALYFVFYRPSVKQTAGRVDALGLEERMVTMYELEDDDSYIARRQREDTAQALATVNSKLLKFAVPLALSITTGVTFLVSASMTTLSVLADNGVISSGSEMVEEANKAPKTYYTVQFEVDGEGKIEGEAVQSVAEGENAAAVTAVAADDWLFAGWAYNTAKNFDAKNAETNPYKLVENVERNVRLVAVFRKVEGCEDDEYAYDNADDLPPQEGSGGPGGKGGGSGGGERTGEEEKVYDGKTDYSGENYRQAYTDEVERLGEDGEIDPDRKKLVIDYLDAIER